MALTRSLLAVAVAAVACSHAMPTTRSAADADVCWRAQGSGPAVLLIGGGGMDLRQWDAVAENLQRDHRVIRFDHRGWGCSPDPVTPFARTDDVRTVLDEADAREAVIVGNSFGGGVALDFALDVPERVRSLILVGSELGGFEWSQAFVERGTRFATADSAHRIELLLADPHFIPAASDDAALRRRTHALLAENLAGIFTIDYSLVRQPPIAAIRRLAELRVPVLVVVPGSDHPDLFAIADTLTLRIDGAERMVLDGAGHMVHLERPAEFAGLVREHVASLR